MVDDFCKHEGLTLYCKQSQKMKALLKHTKNIYIHGTSKPVTAKFVFRGIGSEKRTPIGTF